MQSMYYNYCSMENRYQHSSTPQSIAKIAVYKVQGLTPEVHVTSAGCGHNNQAIYQPAC